MQVTKTLIALAVAAGFASAAFAQGATPATPAAPAAKVTAPASGVAEKKVEATKAAEPAKLETTKTDTGKPAIKHAKAKGHAHRGAKHEAKTEHLPAAAPAPASK